jgi:hypothetical protein
MRESNPVRIHVRWTSESGDASTALPGAPEWRTIPVARWSLVMAALSDLVRKRAIPAPLAGEVCDDDIHGPICTEFATR